MSSRDIVLVALFAAIMAALALVPPVTLPLGIPITAQSMGPMLAGGIIGARRGGLAMLLFLVLVAIGLPLLAGGRGGWAVFAGPSAGYIVAWPIAAWAIGLATARASAAGTGRLFTINLMFGVVLVHAIGIPVLAAVLGIPLWDAVVGDLLFVPGDVLKAALAAIVAVQLRRAYPAFALRS